MAYNKPIEIKITSQNTKGTEVNAVRLLDTIEKQLKTVLKEGDLFKSPRASVDYNTHAVTKSFFVRSEAENLVRDIINLQKDNFYREPSITSNQARMRSYKVDIEGEKALAALRADTAALGGRVYGNQHGNYVEIPNYKGARKDALGRAEELTNKLRIKIADEAEREEERQEKQKKKEAEKEERQKEAERKQHSIALIAGLSSSVMLLKKLVSLVENIMNGVIDAGEKSFKTTMDAMRLNIDTIVLRNLLYAGMSKGIGSAPVDILTTMQSLFGTTLLAAKNVGKIDDMAPVIGEVIGDLIRNGQVGTDPMGLASAVLDSVVQAYKEGKNALGQTGGTQSANAASLITMVESNLGESWAQIVTRMFQDIDAGKDVSSYQSWITAAMPVSSPSNANVASGADSYSDYLVAIAELKSIIDLIKITLSPLLDPLTEAIQKLNGFLLRLTGNTEGVAELNKKSYAAMQAAITRDKAEVEKLESVEKDYLNNNKDLFKDSKEFDKAITDFQMGITPSWLNEKQLKDFNAIAFVAMYKKKLQDMLLSYNKKEEDYAKDKQKYIDGEKTFSFVDADLAQNFAATETLYKNVERKSNTGYRPATQQESIEMVIRKSKEAKKEKEAIAAREAKVKQMAMDELVPNLIGDSGQKFFYERQISKKLREETEKRIRGELELLDSKSQEYVPKESMEEAIAKALDEASARIILQGVDKTTDLGTATSAKVSRDLSGNLRVDLYVNDKFAKSVEANVSNTEANSLAAGETVEIDLYRYASQGD
jgi:hypothetical protein